MGVEEIEVVMSTVKSSSISHSFQKNIPQESYFPFTWKILGALLIPVALILLSLDMSLVLRVFLSLLLITLGLMMISTRYGLKVDIEKKTYVVYTWLLGFRIGNPVPFQNIQKYYINSVKEQATVSARSGLSSTISKEVFKAYMKLDTGDKIHLDTHRNKKILESQNNNSAPV